MSWFSGCGDDAAAGRQLGLVAAGKDGDPPGWRIAKSKQRSRLAVEVVGECYVQFGRAGEVVGAPLMTEVRSA